MTEHNAAVCPGLLFFLTPKLLLSFPFSVMSPRPLPPLPSDSSDVVALLGLVCAPLPAGVCPGAGGLRSMPLLPRARAAGRPQVEQQNSPASPAGGQCELHG